MEKGIHQSGHNPDTREPDEQKGDTYLQNVFLQLITSSLTLSDQGHLQMLGKKKKKMVQFPQLHPSVSQDMREISSFHWPPGDPPTSQSLSPRSAEKDYKTWMHPPAAPWKWWWHSQGHISARLFLLIHSWFSALRIIIRTGLILIGHNE